MKVQNLGPAFALAMADECIASVIDQRHPDTRAVKAPAHGLRDPSDRADGLGASDINADNGTNATLVESSPFVHRFKRAMPAGDTDVTRIAELR
jgi:hypothetical protein